MSVIGETFDLVGDVLYSPIRGAGFFLETGGSCAANIVGLTDGARCAFTARFAKQVFRQGLYESIISHGAQNPIKRITEIVVGHSQKSSPMKYVEAVAKFAIKREIKNRTVKIVVKTIVDYTITTYAARYASKKVFGITVTGMASFGIGSVLTVESIVDQSYYSAMHLKQKNPAIYYKLYALNLECYWFLVAKELKDFI